MFKIIAQNKLYESGSDDNDIKSVSSRLLDNGQLGLCAALLTWSWVHRRTGSNMVAMVAAAAVLLSLSFAELASAAHLQKPDRNKMLNTDCGWDRFNRFKLKWKEDAQALNNDPKKFLLTLGMNNSDVSQLLIDDPLVDQRPLRLILKQAGFSSVVLGARPGFMSFTPPKDSNAQAIRRFIKVLVEKYALKFREDPKTGSGLVFDPKCFREAINNLYPEFNHLLRGKRWTKKLLQVNLESSSWIRMMGALTGIAKVDIENFLLGESGEQQYVDSVCSPQKSGGARDTWAYRSKVPPQKRFSPLQESACEFLHHLLVVVPEKKPEGDL